MVGPGSDKAYRKAKEVVSVTKIEIDTFPRF